MFKNAVVDPRYEIDSNIKTCAVPCCNSNTSICPKKTFVEVPSQACIRYNWLKRANIRPYTTTSILYFCADHFEKRKGKLILHTPNKFECQYFLKESANFDPLCSSIIPVNKEIFYPFKNYGGKKTPKTTENTTKKEIDEWISRMQVLKKKSLEQDKKVKPPRKKKEYISNTTPRKNAKYQIKCYTKLYENERHTNRLLLEHDYAKVLWIQPLIITSGDNHRRGTERNSCHKQKFTKSDEDTDSAKSIQTFQCDHCKIEYIKESDLSYHIHMVHQSEINQSTELSVLSFGALARSIKTFKCSHCGIEFIQQKDLLVHIQEKHSHNGDDMLDIKSEIYQCNKCPSSFPTEEEVLKHLWAMHGNYYNTKIKKVASCKDFARIISHIPYNEGSYESNTKSQCEGNFSDFTEFTTNIEIKREYDNPLEDIELSIDNQNFHENDQVFHQTDKLDHILTENQCALNENADWVTDTSPNIKISLIESLKEFEPEEKLNTKEYEYSLSRNSDENLDLDLGYSSTTIPEVVQCKTCRKTFATQEELLDHMHDLINTKTRLYAEAKKSLKADSVKFKHPFKNSHNGLTQYLSEAELLDYIHRVHDKSRNDKINLQVERYVDNEDNSMCKQFLPDTMCRCCGKPLAKLVIKKNRDKICPRCRRMQINYEGRKFSTAKLYASAKNMLLQSQDRKSVEHIKANPDQHETVYEANNHKPVTNQEAMHGDDYIISNESKNWHDIADSPPIFGDNDLLTPLREEDETILVQSFDPSLCKSCRKPLNPSRPNNSTICVKCKQLDEENEKRKKNKGKRRAFNRKQRDSTNKIEEETYCYICNYKFHSNLELREHVARSHV